MFGMMSFAQTRQLTGVIRDEQNSEPIMSATVKVRGSNTSTTSDAEGRFSLMVPTGDFVLEVTSVGFGARAINVTAADNDISVTMTEGSGQDLETVVVTALGIRKERKALGYAVTEVKGEDLTKARSNNMVNALQGRVPGMNVTSTATGAGGSARVVIRGNVSIFGNNQPLYVVDGIPIDNSNRGSAGEWGGRDAGDGIQMINPDEIETISVLKGGAAAALYGSRSATGVILITTKKGSKRKGVGIEINSNMVVEKINNISDWQYEYGHGTLGAAPTTLEGANNIPLNTWGGKLNGQNVIQWDGESRPYVAVKDNLERFYRTGTNFTNTVKMYGGSDKMTYNFTVSDLANTSIVPNSSIHRNNFLLNTVINPLDKLTVNLNVRYIRERSKNRPRLSDSPGNANFTVGLMPTSWDVETFRTSMLDANGNENKFNNNDYVTNPYWATYRFGQRDTRDRFIGLIEAKYDLTSWLYVRGRLSTDSYTRTNFEYTPSGTKYSPGGQINDQTTNKFREFNGEWLVGANKEFSKFGIEGFVGGNMMIQKDEGQSFWGDNFFAPNFYHISNLQNRNTAFNYSEKRINSLFGSAEVNYNKYLYLTFTGRNDWFSTLSPENWSIFYPSVGASFVLSDAFAMPAFLDFAKIRTGWASVGGDRDPYGLALPYSLGNPYNGLPVGNIGTGTIPNRGLKPFTVTTVEFGFETRMFNNRFGIDFTYYDRKTEDDIVSSQISGTSGFGSVLLNVGEVSNKGIELLLTGGLISTKNFSWDASFNVGYNKGIVVKISDQLTTARIANARSLTAFVDHIAGQEYGQVMGYDFRRNDKGELVLNNGRPQRGEFVSFGSGAAPYSLGLQNSFRFGAFTASILVDGKFGGVMYSGTNDFATFRGLHKQTLEGREGGIVVDGVDANGAPNTTSITAQDYWQSVGLNISAPFIYKSDFIKLRELVLSYNINSKLIERTPFKGASLSIVGRNLAIIKKWVPNVDPEAVYNSGNGQGLEWYGVPPIRSFGVNLNLRF